MKTIKQDSIYIKFKNKKQNNVSFRKIHIFIENNRDIYLKIIRSRESNFGKMVTSGIKRGVR